MVPITAGPMPSDAAHVHFIVCLTCCPVYIQSVAGLRGFFQNCKWIQAGS